jgi:Flp pilus assembly protein TadD
VLAAGILYEAQGKLPEARQGYEKLVGRYPLLSPAVRRLVLLSADVTTDDQKVYDLAQKAREMYPDDPDVARVAGMAAYRRRDYSRAAQLLKESVTRGQANADAHFQLGMACMELKRVPEARENLNKALTLNPNGKFATQAKEALAQLK